jgi:hypothetical protein
MPVDAEREINRLHGALSAAQGAIKATHYEWRQAALELAGPNADPMVIALKFWEIAGKDLAKGFLPTLNKSKGEEALMMSVARLLAATELPMGLWLKLKRAKALTNFLSNGKGVPGLLLPNGMEPQ